MYYPTMIIRWQTTRRKKVTFFVMVFFLSCIDVCCLLSSSSSIRMMLQSPLLRSSHPPSIVQCLLQSKEFSHGIKTTQNNTDEGDRRHHSFPIAKTTKIKVNVTDDDQQKYAGFEEHYDNDSATIGIEDHINNSAWKNHNKSYYYSLEKVTRDLLDVNQTVTGSWAQRDCDKVINVIGTWTKRTGGPGRPEPAVQQERLLRRVIEEKQAANVYALDLNLREIYHKIIFSWSKSYETGSSNRAEEILDAMQHAYNSGEDRDLQPAIDAWNSILGSYAQSRSKDAKEHAMRVFNKLYRLISEGQTDARPNDESYAHILKAVASTGELDAPKHVLDLLIRMENLSQNGFSIDVTSSCHNVYLTSLVESMKDSRVSAPKTARLAESHLRKMKENPNPDSKPDRRSEYNSVIAN